MFIPAILLCFTVSTFQQTKEEVMTRRRMLVCGLVVMVMLVCTVYWWTSLHQSATNRETPNRIVLVTDQVLRDEVFFGEEDPNECLALAGGSLILTKRFGEDLVYRYDLPPGRDYLLSESNSVRWCSSGSFRVFIRDSLPH